MAQNEFNVGDLVYFVSPTLSKSYGIITNINENGTCDIDATYTYYGAYDLSHYNNVSMTKLRDGNSMIDAHINKLKRQIEQQEKIKNTKNPKELKQKISQSYKLNQVIEQATE